MALLDSDAMPPPFVIESSEGIKVTDQTGNTFLDGGAGLWCVNIGYSRQDMAATAWEAMGKNCYSTIFGNATNQPIKDLGDKLLGLLRTAGYPHFSKVFFGMSGSDANDTALKIISHYHGLLGNSGKTKLIALEGGYHGLTCSTTPLAGIPAYSTASSDVIRLTMPHYYRNGKVGESEEQFTNRLLKEASDAIQLAGPRTIAAFIAEPILGVGGVIIPPTNYFLKLQALLKQHSILFIADEVITGCGRAGSWFGSTPGQIEPDIMTFAKGLTSGYFPLSASVISKKIVEVLASTGKPFMHGFTTSGHPVGAALALTNIEILEREELVFKAKEGGDYLQKCLKQKLAGHPFIGEIRGVGQMHGIEYVIDKANKTFFSSQQSPQRVVSMLAKAHGLLCRPLPYIHVNSLSPAFITTHNEADEIVEKLGRALIQAIPALTIMAEEGGRLKAA